MSRGTVRAKSGYPPRFAYEVRAALGKLFQRLVDVLYGEHDPEVS